MIKDLKEINLKEKILMFQLILPKTKMNHLKLKV